MAPLHRRTLLAAAATWPFAVRADALEALRRGGCALLLRHAATDPGVGDPPDFRLGDCGTQRNLSAEGREQAARIGAWFAARGLRPSRVRSSPWCRCLDTARIAFGRAEVYAPLASFFGESQRRDAQTAALREALAALPAQARGGFEVWVTHQVNISALTGEGIAMGAAVVLRGVRDGAAVRVQNLGSPNFS